MPKGAGAENRSGGVLIIGNKLKKVLTYLLVLTFGLSLFGNFLTKSAKAADYGWGAQGTFNFSHTFKLNEDKTLIDAASYPIDGGTAALEVNYGAMTQTISWWKFFDAVDHSLGNGNLTEDLNNVVQLSKHTYLIAKLPGTDTFYIIIDSTTDKTMGIFKKTTINKCYTGESEGATKACPWEYYKAYSSWGGSLGKFVYINEKGDQLKPDYELQASPADSKSKLYQYIISGNSQQYSILGPGGTIDCASAGSSLSADEYAKCFFPEGGRFEVSIKDNGDKPPTIAMSGSSFDQSKHPGAQRPRITFTLNFVLRSRFNAVNAPGANDNYFYFVSTDPSHPNLAIRIKNCQSENYFVTTGDQAKLEDDVEIGKSLSGATEPIAVVNVESIMNSLINKVYNNGPYSSGNCPENFINWEDNGQLAKWSVQRVDRVEFTPPDEGAGGTCGLPWYKVGTMQYWIAKALCGVLGLIGDLADMIINGLFYSVFNAYHPPDHQKFALLTAGFYIPKAHAAYEDTPVSPLIEAFTNAPNKWGWVITVWRTTLGLTDLFLVIILLFLGIVNILHIQYDTYAIKKALPLLIIGIILANFSLLIMRMLIDAANILTQSFMGGSNPGKMAHDLIYNFGLSKNQAALPAFASGWNTVGGLFLAIIFSFFVIAAFFILGVMFYVRYAAILLLGIAAPLAFIALAFPPTQSLFKQWWSWATKMIFMKPVAFFLLFIALKAKESGAGTGIVGWMIITAIVYMAILVPWKLGGAVMAMWGGAMGSIFGTKKGGWARKPVDDWWQRRKDMAGAKLKRMPGLSWLSWRGIRDKDLTESAKKQTEGMLRQKARGDNKYAQGMSRAQLEEDKAKELRTLQELGISTGTYDPMLGLKPIKSTKKYLAAMKLSGEIRNVGATLQRAMKGLDKDKAFATILELGADLEDGNRLAERFEKEFKVLTEYDVDEKGKLKETGKKTHYGDTKKMADELRLRSHTEENPEIQRNLQLSAQSLDDIARGFETEHRDLPFQSYLNRNLNGRQIALLWPLVNDEMKTNADNESRKSFNKMLFGDETGDAGGGSGDIRWSGKKPVQNFVRGQRGMNSFHEKAAVNFALGGYKMRALGNGPDSQDMLADLVEGMSNPDYAGPELWQGYLRDIEKQRTGSLRSMLVEYNRDAILRGGKTFGITDQLAKSLVGKSAPDQTKALNAAIDELGEDGILAATSPDILREMNPNSYAAKEQRYILNQIKSKVAFDERFGGGRNVILTIADVKNKTENENNTSAASTSTPSGGTPSSDPNAPSGPTPPSPQAQELARAITSTNPAELKERVGSYSRILQDAYDFTQPSNAAMVIDNLRAGLAQKLIPDNLSIDLSLPQLEQLIEKLSNLDINLDHDQVEAELRAVLPEATLDRKISVKDYITQAKEVESSQNNLQAISEGAIAEQVDPYVRTAINQNPDKISEHLDKLETAAATLLEAMGKIESLASKSLVDSIPKEVIEGAVQSAQDARGGGVPLNTQFLKNDPVELASVMQKLIIALKTAKYYNQSPTKDPEAYKVAMKKAVREGMEESEKTAQTQPAQGQGGREQAQQPAQPAAPEPQPEQPQGPAGGPPNANELM